MFSVFPSVINWTRSLSFLLLTQTSSANKATKFSSNRAAIECEIYCRRSIAWIELNRGFRTVSNIAYCSISVSIRLAC